MEGLTAVFSGKAAAQESARTAEAEVGKLHARIGQLLAEPGPADRGQFALPHDR